MFELIITNEIVDNFVTLNSYANQSTGDKCYSSGNQTVSCHIGLLWNVFQPKGHLTKNKLFETPRFKRIISQSKMVLLEKCLDFLRS